MNRALADQINMERARIRMPNGRTMSVRALAEKADLPVDTLRRQLKNERDLTVTQVGLMADALGLPPEELVRRAIDNAGGMDALVNGTRRPLSAVPDNVTNLRPDTTGEIDAYMGDKAAYRDDEADTDEPN
jgi:lambda repressor-like predicted transcriptional regulator